LKSIEKILVECVDEIAAGKTTIQECLEKYHDISDELAPLLNLAFRIEKLPEVMPSKSYKARTRAHLMEYIHDYQTSRSPWQKIADAFVQPGWTRGLAIGLAAFVVFASSGAGTAYAAQDSLPGEVLYPVKTGVEDWQAWIETDAAADTALQLSFADRRIEEIERLADKNALANIGIAISGYETNLQEAIRNANGIESGALVENIAVATAGHLNRLDSLTDADGLPLDTAILEAEQIAVKEQVRSLQQLAENNSVRAGELNVAGMQNRLDQAAGATAAGKTMLAEAVLEQYVKYAGLGEGLLQEYAGTDSGMVLTELYQQAEQNQQQFFASFSESVSPSVAAKVHAAFGKIGQGHGQNSSDNIQETGNQGSQPANEEHGSSQGQGKNPAGIENQGQGSSAGEQTGQQGTISANLSQGWRDSEPVTAGQGGEPKDPERKDNNGDTPAFGPPQG
jgi:hypothetical protein